MQSEIATVKKKRIIKMFGHNYDDARGVTSKIGRKKVIKPLANEKPVAVNFVNSSQLCLSSFIFEELHFNQREVIE